MKAFWWRGMQLVTMKPRATHRDFILNVHTISDCQLCITLILSLF